MKQRGNELAKTAVLSALIAVVGTLYLLAVLNAVPPHPDLDIFVRGARDLLGGRPLYDAYLNSPGDPTLRYGFIYPPLFAMLTFPLALLPAGVIPAVWLLLTNAALAAAFWLVFRQLRASRTIVLLAIALTFGFYPLWADASQGQANLLILLLVTLGIVGVSRGNARSGIWIGLAAALKVTPVLLIIWLLWERRLRAAAWMAGSLAAFTGLGALIRPADTVTYATKVLPMLASGTAYWSNQSLAGVAARLFSDTQYTSFVVYWKWWPVAVDLVGGAALIFWLVASRRLDRGLARGVSFLPLLPLLSAVSWEHHLVILLPLVWVLIAQAPTLTLPRKRGREFEGMEPGARLARLAVLALAILCLLVIPHLPVGPPYATQFSRAAGTSNPFLIAAANRLLVGTLLLFVVTPSLTLPRKRGRERERKRGRETGVAQPWPPGMWSSSELDRPA